MERRWLRNSEIEDFVNPALKAKGWAELNLDTCRVMGAFADDGHLIEFLVIQLYPLLGPMLRVDNEHRDSGATSRALAEDMYAYLEREQARGFFAIAESPVTRKLCERYGMKPVAFPVYGFVNESKDSEIPELVGNRQ
jgi:hypothetical protein